MNGLHRRSKTRAWNVHSKLQVTRVFIILRFTHRVYSVLEGGSVLTAVSLRSSAFNVACLGARQGRCRMYHLQSSLPWLPVFLSGTAMYKHVLFISVCSSVPLCLLCPVCLLWVRTPSHRQNYYVAGYVARKCIMKTNCQDCMDSLTLSCEIETLGFATLTLHKDSALVFFCRNSGRHFHSMLQQKMIACW